MNIELSEDVILGVLQQIEAAPRATSISSLTGDRPLNLLAVRELKRRGLITGKFLNDSTRPGDQMGPFLYDAARLEPL